MAERFIKFIPSESAMKFAIKYKNAFILLLVIAESARRTNGSPDGVTVGQCHLGNHKNYGMTEKEYRYAKQVLVDQGLIKIVVTNRTRKKGKQTQKLFEQANGATERATEPTTTGTLVELCNSDVWDINSDASNQQKGDRNGDPGATEGRLKGDKQEGRRKKKKEKEDHPSIPSGRDRMKDDFSSEKKKIEIIPGIFLTQEDMQSCLKIKGTEEKVRDAVQFIQSSKKRKHPISDWPNTLMKWKIEDKGKARIEDHIAYTEKLCKEFQEFDQGHGWRCHMYNDTRKDQRGILFECQSPYQEAFFVALIEGELKEKCEDFIRSKNMRKK